MVRNLWVTFIKKPYMKLLDGGVSLGDTIRTTTKTNHFLGGRNPRLIPF